MPSFLSVLIAQTDNERRVPAGSGGLIAAGFPPVSLSATQNDFVLHLAPPTFHAWRFKRRRSPELLKSLAVCGSV